MSRPVNILLSCAVFFSSVSAETEYTSTCAGCQHPDQREITRDTDTEPGDVKRELRRAISVEDKLYSDVHREHSVNTQRTTTNEINVPSVRLHNDQDLASNSQTVHGQHTKYVSSRAWIGTPGGTSALRPNDSGQDHTQTARSGYSVRTHTFNSDENVPGTMRKQYVLTLSETSCTAALSVIRYNITLRVPVVVEFKMRSDSEFIRNKCSLHLVAPNTTAISVVLLEMACGLSKWQRFVFMKDSFNRRKKWLSCVRYINPGVDWMSKGNTLMINLHVTGDGLFTARMDAMAVVRPQPGTIHTRYLTPTLGYIQNAEIPLNYGDISWNNTVKTNTWSHLDVPGHKAVLLSVAIAGFGSLPPAKVCQHRVELYEGSMNKTVWRLCSRYHSLPQPHISHERDLRVHYVSGWNHEELKRGFGFRLIFTIHDKSRIPVQLANGKWNCSTPTWLTFHEHFICDLVTHCAGDEDERDCPHFTKCRHNGALSFRHGKCYSLEKMDEGATWHEANAVCSSLGSGGRLAPFHTTILKFSETKLRHDLTVFSGNIMLVGVSTANQESHL